MAGLTTTISALPLANSIDGSNDYLAIDNAGTVETQRINRRTFLGVAGQPADISSVQTVTNKVLDNTNTLVLKDTNFTLQDNSDVTKQIQFQLSGITTATIRTFTLPDRSSTIATLGGTQTFTGANSFSGSSWSNGTIDNATITVDSISGHTSANIGTIYGISINSGSVSVSGTLSVTGASSLANSLSVAGSTSLSSTLGTIGQPTFMSSTAPPAAGSSADGILLSSTASFGIFFGSGAPTFSAAHGSIYLRTDGSSTSTRLYVNTTGSTTWTNFTSAA